MGARNFVLGLVSALLLSSGLGTAHAADKPLKVFILVSERVQYLDLVF